MNVSKQVFSQVMLNSGQEGIDNFLIYKLYLKCQKFTNLAHCLFLWFASVSIRRFFTDLSTGVVDKRLSTLSTPPRYNTAFVL